MLIQSKLSKTRAGERTRIWLEGVKLSDNGFPYASKFRKRIAPGRIVITPLTHEDFAETPRADRGTISGSIERPVIDLTGALIAQTFKSTHVSVRITQNRIEITEA